MKITKSYIDSLFEEYENFIRKDIKDHVVNVHTVANLIAKFQEVYYFVRYRIIELSKKLDEIWFDRYEYYKTEYPHELKTNEIREMIERDEKYGKVKYKIEEYKNILDRVEKSMKNLDSVRWDVRNFIEWKKIENGII